MKDPVHFWYEFASTYSYLSAMRIEAVADAAGAQLVWRPFLLGPIFAEQGWNDSPFNIYPTKGRYMWRDLERLCDEYALDFSRPSVFPRNGLRAARIACIAADEGWCAELTRAVFVANFAEDREISDTGVLAEILTDLGRDSATVIEASDAPTNKERLRAQTEEAKHHGIFGAPSFTVGKELFWGNDRLGAAIAWSLGLR
ncbi:MAG: 2-hydroxychromene-2-carboxylate isomerase [Myxococcales bacterium]|nr:2-hydroxychromene-2-carboxylate isomerase [Myxococcales bacterium]MDH3844991.1 2-hydroxychromene-2-carboxylate isomerase [Myxococcales bacterium]